MSCPVCGKNHRGRCHECPHAEFVAMGRYSAVPWEQAPCSACRLVDEPSHKGACHVEEAAADLFPAMAPEQASSLMDFFGAVLELSSRERFIVLRRWRHVKGLEQWPFHRIGQACGVSAQAVHHSFGQVVERIPALAVLWGPGGDAELTGRP